MKVNYITEGYFKNPGQVKADREKEKELSNADRVVGLVNKLTKEPIIRYLNWVYDEYAFEHAKNEIGNKYLFINDRIELTATFITENCLCLYPKKVMGKDRLFAKVEPWVYKYMDIHVDDVFLDEKRIKLTIELGTPRQRTRSGPIIFGDGGSYGARLNNAKDVGKPFDTDMVVIFFKVDELLGPGPKESANKLFKRTYSFLYYYLKSYITLALDDRVPDKEVRDFLFDDKLQIDYEIKLNFENDVLLAPILQTHAWNLSDDIVYSHLAFPAFSSSSLNGGANTRERDMIDNLYPFVRDYEHKFMGIIPYFKQEPERDCSWDAKLDFWKVTGPNGLGRNALDKTIEKLKKEYPGGYEAVADKISTVLKQSNMQLIGQGHIYLSTGYFKKNYLIL